MTRQSSQIFSELNPFTRHSNKDCKPGMYSYIPSGIDSESIKPAMKAFQAQTGRKAKTFIDLGCGKGGAMYTALDAGLTPTGVELSSELLKLANRIKELRLVPKSEKLTFIKGNILKWKPDKEYDIVYFYHPLADPVLHTQFIQHVYSIFPSRQIVLALGECDDHLGFKRDKNANYLYRLVDKPTTVDYINNKPVVAEIDGNYILKDGYKPRYLKISAASIKQNDRLQWVSTEKPVEVKFKIRR